ncbi:tRNA-splicing endonuclease subunit Sen2 isoform X4 [Syngnathoides biaculeatus]|uniref:tRNA-splicing endonuclease subunit Sen2 isoform X4 n=1 Tax=Syngnathoides biaculeatus TaxID=300417 RepID=UPI002ADDA050|nr:tRNA-splicing endonuclease subunit Sen2 isoform X4 [Syngnathoides biaculeatus]
MQADFRPPRRRCRVYEEYAAPFPVSRSSPRRRSASRPTTSCFRADLVNRHVLVTEPEHVSEIYNRGYFGKAVLSRARPERFLSERRQQVEGFLLPVITQHRYEELLGWAESALLSRGLADEAVNQTLLRLRRPVRLDDVRREAEDADGDAQARPRVDFGPELSHSSDCEPSSGPAPDRGSVSDCDSDLDDGSLVPGPGFVVVASDADDRVAVETHQLRRNPLRLSEYLQLGLEEAFFLVYSLGCLSVHLEQEPLSVAQLWRRFVSLRPDFVSAYAAYHHFRSRGWVPKGGSGAKYGVDMLLYRKGPPFYHASYSVVVEKVDEDFAGSTLRPFSWRSLATLSRITDNVSKELLLCYVVLPADLSETELDSPACLSKLKVQVTPSGVAVTTSREKIPSGLADRPIAASRLPHFFCGDYFSLRTNRTSLARQKRSVRRRRGSGSHLKTFAQRWKGTGTVLLQSLDFRGKRVYCSGFGTLHLLLSDVFRVCAGGPGQQVGFLQRSR